MRKMSLIVAFAIGCAGLKAKLIPGDAKRGAESFRAQRCINCHAIRGEGGGSGPDLGLIIGRDYTPSWLASIMWNHAPAMWAAMEQQGLPRPRMTEEQAADLFAYFHSIRFFERPGDAGRGKQVFLSKRCADCHGISSTLVGGAPAVATWQSLAAPLALAQQMWNHAGKMREVMTARGIRWPTLASQEMSDLLVYLQNLPATRGRVGQFALGAVGEGETLLKTKGCVNCHQGKLALESRSAGNKMTDWAASMWNHAPRMWAYNSKTGQKPPQLEQDEMRQIVAYLWYVQLFAEPGSSARGRRVFEGKNCGLCHNDPSSGAPDLKKTLAGRSDPLRPFSMASVLWQHGPAMLERMKAKKLAWPRFSRPEMVNLMAYLNGPEFRGTAPSKEMKR
jgi:mono/diheme cytochrome c family protein